MRPYMATLLLAGTCLMLASGARAQQDASGSFVGTTSDRPGCPSVTLHIIRDGGRLTGVVFYTNGSGASLITGQVVNGTISWHQTPTNGRGPTGDVNGTINASGVMRLNLTGTPCHFQATLPLTPTYGVGNGSG